MVVYAAENDRLAHGIEAIPYGDFKYCLVIIVIAGSLSTLVKVTNSNAPKVTNLVLEVCKDALGSLVAGFFGYLVISWIDQEVYKIHILLQPVFIFFCAFGGIRLILPVYDRGFAGGMGILEDFLNRFSNKQKNAPQSEDKP